MTAKKIEKQDSETAQESAPAEGFPNELTEQMWAVITFEKCAASNLTYAEAEQKMRELEAQKVSGLCIVTNEVGEKYAA